MFVVCWSAKGGAGTSVVAAAMGLMSAADGIATLLVDLDGDQASILGLAEPAGPGVGDWLDAGDDVPVDALAELEIPVGANLSLLGRGDGSIADVERLALLGSILAGSGRSVIVDAGATGPLRWWAGLAESILVSRACYLAVRRAGRVPADTQLVLIDEPGRALRVDDVLMATGASLRCRVAHDPAVARAVDAGLFTTRLPRSLRPLGSKR